MPSKNHTPTTAPAAPRLELADVRGVTQRHPALSEAAVRSLIHRRRVNGLGEHVYKVGRRIWIDLNGFDAWLRDRRMGSA